MLGRGLVPGTAKLRGREQVIAFESPGQVIAETRGPEIGTQAIVDEPEPVVRHAHETRAGIAGFRG